MATLHRVEVKAGRNRDNIRKSFLAAKKLNKTYSYYALAKSSETCRSAKTLLDRGGRAPFLLQ